MRPTDTQREVFRKGSKTYFNSSLFFPRLVRDDVFILYAFVRVVDDFVDAVPQLPDEFYGFRESYRNAASGVMSGNHIIDSFVDLSRRKGFTREWVEGFFHSMELDLTRNTYQSLDETLEYIYGSAEVIGLFMARIMGLDHAADLAAKMLGRAMQFINFIRDIAEDNELGRTYLPLGETTLPDLTEQSARADPEEFKRFIRAQTARYMEWQANAEDGYSWIPGRYLVPIRTAAEMYLWTGEVVRADPFVVFRTKVKPSRSRILRGIFRNWLRPRVRAPGADS